MLVQDFDNLQRLYEALLKIENPSNRYLQLITWIQAVLENVEIIKTIYTGKIY